MAEQQQGDQDGLAVQANGSEDSQLIASGFTGFIHPGQTVEAEENQQTKQKKQKTRHTVPQHNLASFDLGYQEQTAAQHVNQNILALEYGYQQFIGPVDYQHYHYPVPGDVADQIIRSYPYHLQPTNPTVPSSQQASGIFHGYPPTAVKPFDWLPFDEADIPVSSVETDETVYNNFTSAHLSQQHFRGSATVATNKRHYEIMADDHDSDSDSDPTPRASQRNAGVAINFAARVPTEECIDPALLDYDRRNQQQVPITTTATTRHHTMNEENNNVPTPPSRRSQSDTPSRGLEIDPEDPIFQPWIIGRTRFPSLALNNNPQDVPRHSATQSPLNNAVLDDNNRTQNPSLNAIGPQDPFFQPLEIGRTKRPPLFLNDNSQDARRFSATQSTLNSAGMSNNSRIQNPLVSETGPRNSNRSLITQSNSPENLAGPPRFPRLPPRPSFADSSNRYRESQHLPFNTQGNRQGPRQHPHLQPPQVIGSNYSGGSQHLHPDIAVLGDGSLFQFPPLNGANSGNSGRPQQRAFNINTNAQDLRGYFSPTVQAVNERSLPDNDATPRPARRTSRTEEHNGNDNDSTSVYNVIVPEVHDLVQNRLFLLYSASILNHHECGESNALGPLRYVKIPETVEEEKSERSWSPVKQLFNYEPYKTFNVEKLLELSTYNLEPLTISALDHSDEDEDDQDAEPPRKRVRGRGNKTAPRFDCNSFKKGRYVPDAISEPWPYGLINVPQMTDSGDTEVVEYYMAKEGIGRPVNAPSNETPAARSNRLANLEMKRASRDREAAIKDLNDARLEVLDYLKEVGPHAFKDWLGLDGGFTGGVTKFAKIWRNPVDAIVRPSNVKDMYESGVYTGQYSTHPYGFPGPFNVVALNGTHPYGGFIQPTGRYTSPYKSMVVVNGEFDWDPEWEEEAKDVEDDDDDGEEGEEEDEEEDQMDVVYDLPEGVMNEEGMLSPTPSSPSSE